MIYTVSESLGYEVNGHNRHKGKTPTKRRHLLPNPITGGNDEYLTITQITPNPPPVKGSQQGSVNTQFTEDPLIKVSGSMDSGDLDTIERSGRDVQDKIRAQEKAKDISQDETHRYLEQLQKTTDSSVAAIDKTGEVKEAELLEV